MTGHEISDRLSEPFEPGKVRWKPQAVKGNRALAVAYVNGREVMERLDDVVGPGGWRTEYLQIGPQSVECRLSIKVDGEWVTKSDVGSTSEQPDEGDRMKAAYSDALKRAAVNWGVGRYIYALPQSWWDYDPQRKQFSTTPQLPAWALPKRNGQTATPHHAPPPPQSQPQPQRPANPQPSAVALPQQSQPPAGSVADELVALAKACRTAGELEANAFVVDVRVKDGSLDPAGIARVQEVWVERCLLLVQYTNNERKLNEVGAVLARCFRDGNRMSDVQYKRVADAVAARYSQFAPVEQPVGDEQPW